MLAQFVPTLLGALYTSDATPVPGLQAIGGPNGPSLITPGGGLTTATGASLTAWLGVPLSAADLATFASAERMPTSLRLWRTGSGSTASNFVRPTYRLYIVAPATFAPTTSPNSSAGTYDPATPILTPISNAVTDSPTWGALHEITLTLNTAPLPGATYQRGQIMIYVTLPSSDGGAGLQIFGGGFLG